jgi:CRISPR-associated protein Cmr6
MSARIQAFKLPYDTTNLIKEYSLKPDNFNLCFNKYRKWDNEEKMKNLPDKPSFKFNYIEEVKKRQLEILTNYKKLDCDVLLLQSEVDWKMVVGLGHPHVAETSMTLHHIYGMPYIPGSAIKGITRHFYINNVFEKIEIENNKQILIVEKILENFEFKKDKDIEFDGFREKFKYKDKDKEILPIKELYDFFSERLEVIEEFQLIFGTQRASGKVIFLDAYPISNVNLENDVMTPHYQPYYSDKDSKIPPADYFDPIPIKFLTVKDTKFQFGLTIKSKINAEKIINLLKNSLENYGIGAKTAVGYGYFKNIENKTSEIDELIEEEEQGKAKIKESEILKDMSEAERECYLLKTINDNKKWDKSLRLYNKIDNFEDNEKIMIAKTLKEIWQRLEKWQGKKLSKKQKEKVKRIKSIIGGNHA